MKLKNMKTPEFRKRGYAVAVAFSLCLIFCFSLVRVSAQKAQQRITSIWTATGADGSRVTLASDKQLNDYEAYSRGDRFYVKIPLADLPSTTGSLLGRGFDDVQIHRVGDGILISFRLQPGTTARVNQKSNRLEVVFSIPLRSQSYGSVAAGNEVTNGTRARTIRDTAGPTPPPSIREYQTGPDSIARHGERGARTTGSDRGSNSRAKSSASNVQKSLREKAGGSSLPAANSTASSNQSRPSQSPSAGKSSETVDSTAKGSVTSASPLPPPGLISSPTPVASPSSSLAVASPSGTPQAAPATQQTTAAASPAPVSASTGKRDWSSRLHNYKEWVRLNPIPFVVAGLVFVALLLLVFVRGGGSRRRGASVERKERPRTQTDGPGATNTTTTTQRTTSKPAEDPDREVFEL